MSIIKSYTDIEQSKKLAEILPLESADMCYKCLGEDPYDIVMRPYTDWKEEYKGLLISGDANVFPCWSLAALLGVLPVKSVGNHYLTLYKEGKEEYCCCYEDANGNGFRHNFANNPIDACYEMIIRLNEFKMF